MQFTTGFLIITSQLSQLIIAITLPTPIASHPHNNNFLNLASQSISRPLIATIATIGQTSTSTSTTALKQGKAQQQLGKRNLDTDATVTTESIKFIVNGEEVLSTYTYTLTTPVNKLIN